MIGVYGMASSEEYRRLAADCIALAQKAAGPHDRARLLQMAQTWRDLANKHDVKSTEDDVKSTEQ
jgi:hypothetical protein